MPDKNKDDLHHYASQWEGGPTILPSWTFRSDRKEGVLVRPSSCACCAAKLQFAHMFHVFPPAAVGETTLSSLARNSSTATESEFLPMP